MAKAKASAVVDLTGDDWRDGLVSLFEPGGLRIAALAPRTNNVPKIFASESPKETSVATLTQARENMFSIMGLSGRAVPPGLFSNMIIAGGSVAAALEGKDRSRFSANGDVDIFIYGLQDRDIRAKISSLWTQLKTTSGSQCVKTPNTISFVIPGPLYKATVFQIICRAFVDPVQTMSAFDIDCCGVCFDGNQFFGLPRAVDAIATRTNTVNLALRSWAYEKRLVKYARRGYAIAVEGFRREEAEIRVVCPASRGYNAPKQGEAGPTEKMGFDDGWGCVDEPSAETYFSATGLRKILLAEYTRDTMGYFGPERPSKFLLKGSPQEVAHCIQLLNASGAAFEDEYPPDMSWARQAGLGEHPYHVASSPAPFLDVSAGAGAGTGAGAGGGKKKKAAGLHAARVVSFPSGPFPPGAYDKSNKDWIGDIYKNHAKAVALNAPPLPRGQPHKRHGGGGGLMREVKGGDY